MKKIHTYAPFLAGLIFYMITQIIFLILAINGWPGEYQNCSSYNACHCETIRPDFIAQPTNTWSNLFFVMFGLWILWEVGAEERKGNEFKNPMIHITPFSVIYAFTIIFTGMGSLYFHGSMRAWANMLDVIGMNMIISFFTLYDIHQLFPKKTSYFILSFFGLNILFALFRIFLDSMRLLIFISFVIITFLIELSIILKGKEWREHPPSWLKNIKIPIRESKWFIIMTSVFIVAIFVWLLWQDTGPLCVPDSWFQGHAIWHFLTALAPFAIYRYLRTEQ